MFTNNFSSLNNYAQFFNAQAQATPQDPQNNGNAPQSGNGNSGNAQDAPQDNGNAQAQNNGNSGNAQDPQNNGNAPQSGNGNSGNAQDNGNSGNAQDNNAPQVRVTIDRPKITEAQDATTARRKVKTSRSTKVKEQKENQEKLNKVLNSFSGLLRFVWCLFKEFDRDVINCFSATDVWPYLLVNNKDTFTITLSNYLKDTIVPALRSVDADGKTVYGSWGWKKLKDEKGRVIKKAHKDKTTGEIKMRDQYVLDENNEQIPEFIPITKWSLKKLFDLVNDNLDRLEDAEKKGVDISKYKFAPNDNAQDAPQNNGNSGNAPQSGNNAQDAPQDPPQDAPQNNGNSGNAPQSGNDAQDAPQKEDVTILGKLKNAIGF